jgi:hypothetical protein
MTAPFQKSVVCPVLIDRVNDLATLQALIDQAKSGRGQVVLLSGPLLDQPVPGAPHAARGGRPPLERRHQPGIPPLPGTALLCSSVQGLTPKVTYASRRGSC